MSTEAMEMPQIRTSPYASPMYNYGSAIVLLTDPDSALRNMELAFRNMTIDAEGKPKGGENPMMNDMGINGVIGQAQAIIDKITILNELKPNERAALGIESGETLIKDLVFNTKKYGIKDATAREKIFSIFIEQQFIIMKRANEEGDRRFWKGSTQEITTRVEGAKQNNSIFSNIVRGMK